MVLLWVGAVTVSTGIGTALGATLFGGDDNRTVSIAVTASGTTPAGGAGGTAPKGAPGAPNPRVTPAPAVPPRDGGPSATQTFTLRCDGAGTGEGDLPDPDATDPSKLAASARGAYEEIRKAMAAADIELSLRSGARSYQHQQLLWETEVACTGSTAEARKRVLPPDESSHVKGTAIDIAPKAAQTWLDKNGSRYGWCRTYDNEPWHFEYAASHKSGCPARAPHP
ncbi:D-alanyl-D-alanine carboxypeptidase family protein [Yinghuangia sp. YIM S09857]|uniref:D-alanyl-D-alanine carboxypeptidase family protein n=1 Tax=Yinghuangia sp. YIM S09857 TaxID=3436929 RepID=UPI003F52E203